MIEWREMRALTRSLALVVVVGLAGAASATAAHMVVPGGTYKGKALKGASFTIASNGKSASFHGMATVGLLCGSKKAPTGPTSTGQSTAELVLDASSAPTLKINNANGTFRGTRRYHGATVTITGKFSTDAKTMVFTVKTSGMCSSSRYTFHSA
jgi:hypothetical protein